MDDFLFPLINGFAGQSAGQDAIIRMLQSDYGKTLPTVLLFWSMWFGLPERRDALVALLLITIPAMVTARLLALNLPFRHRPMYDPESDHNAPADIDPHQGLTEWSAMPSDHATLFFALGVGMFLLSRSYGAVALVHATFVVCLPRVYLAEHWPTDILVGASIGSIIAVVLLKPLTALVRRIRLVPFFEARGWIGYPMLFLATYELSNMFNGARAIVGKVTGVGL